MPLIGFPSRPGELNTYRSAGGSSLGLASRMWWTSTATPSAAICRLNSSATMAPFPYLEAWKYSIFMLKPPLLDESGAPVHDQ